MAVGLGALALLAGRYHTCSSASNNKKNISFKIIQYIQFIENPPIKTTFIKLFCRKGTNGRSNVFSTFGDCWFEKFIERSQVHNLRNHSKTTLHTFKQPFTNCRRSSSWCRGLPHRICSINEFLATKLEQFQ